MAKQPARAKKPTTLPPPQTGGTKPRKQFNLGFSPSMARRIDATAKALGFDAANLLRHIVTIHLAEFERKAADVRKAAAESGHPQE